MNDMAAPVPAQVGFLQRTWWVYNNAFALSFAEVIVTTLTAGQQVSLPDSTVTFLFTDIEGSTRLWEVQPEAMRAALAEHDAILRAAIEGRGGWVIKSTGDAALLNLGRRRLKDLVRPEQIYQLNGPGLPHDFPALRSLSAALNNLPAQPTSFVGREAILAEAGGELSMDGAIALALQDDLEGLPANRAGLVGQDGE